MTQSFIRAIATLLWLLSLLCGAADGGNFRGIAVNTPPEFIEAAERARIQSAKYWIGRELPEWADECDIRWTETRRNGGGSATFGFTADGITRATLHLQGSRESVLHDVIPHEVDHLVRASIVRQRIPRLLDEGAACLFERGDDADGYISILAENADLPTMWENIDAREYPDGDAVGPFYGFGVSLTRFLVAKHGKTKTLELMRGSPSARWESVLGEPLKETQQEWTAYFRGQIRKPVFRLLSAPWCGPCKQFWKEYQARVSGLPYVVVKEWPPLIGGPLEVPAFIAPDGARTTGFGGPGKTWAHWDRWARLHIPAGWQPSADAGQPAAVESVPSTQGQTHDASQQPTAGDIERYQRDAVAKASSLFQAQLDELKAQLLAAQQQATVQGPDGQPPPGQPAVDNMNTSPEGTGDRTTSPSAEGVESKDSASSTREQVKEKAGKAISLVDAIVSNPYVSAAIVGATGGTGVAGLAGWQALMAARRRKKESAIVSTDSRPADTSTQPVDRDGTYGKAGGESPDGFPRLHDRDVSEARESVRLGQLEGRNPLLDSLMGMSFDDVLRRDLERTDLPDEVQRYAADLQREVKQRVDSAAPLSTGKSYSDSWRRGTS